MSDFYALDNEAQAECMQALAKAALVHWDIEADQLDLIKYRENAVFRARASNGVRFAVRIHRAGYHTDDELRSELQWITALAAYGIQVPAIVPCSDGAHFAVVSGGGVPEPRQIDIFEWVDGRQLGAAEIGIADTGSVGQTYHTIGTLAAQLHNQATRWALPEGFTRHSWDTQGLVGPEPFWGPFWELAALTADQRDLLIAARDRVCVDMDDYASKPENAGNFSMIHADFVAENLMVDGDSVRLIDFDDAGFGWHLFELATALYFETGAPYYREAFDALVKGYREHRPLPDSQLECLPLFLLARSFTYLGWVHTRFETETAREMTPMLVEKACKLARDYLALRR